MHAKPPAASATLVLFITETNRIQLVVFQLAEWDIWSIFHSH
jgi:hypothetical protein